MTVLFCFLLIVCCRFHITPPHGQPHEVFGGFISVPGGWMLLCKELVAIIMETCKAATLRLKALNKRNAHNVHRDRKG